MNTKLITAAVLVAILAVLVSFGVALAHQNAVRGECLRFEAEVSEYAAARSLKAAERAFELAEPYLEPESRGELQQRLRTLRHPSVKSYGVDSCGSLILTLANEMQAALVASLGDPNIPYGFEERVALCRGTNWERVERLFALEGALDKFAFDRIVDSAAELEEARVAFGKLKARVEETLAQR